MSQSKDGSLGPNARKMSISTRLSPVRERFSQGHPQFSDWGEEDDNDDTQGGVQKHLRDPMPELSYSDVEVLLCEISDENQMMEHETRYFKRYMDVHMPKALVHEIQAQMSDHDFHGHGGGLLRRTPSKTNTATDRARRARTTGKRTTNATTNHGGTDSVTLRSLTIPQKLAIAERISVELNSTLASERTTTTAAEDELIARIEEASMHTVAVAKWRDVLEREVAGRHTLNKGDYVLSAEKYVRLQDDGQTDLDVGAAAFRLQSAAALKQQRRLATQLRHQQQSGEERMTRVDFEQLRITNARVLETISQKNVQMIELKNIGTSVGAAVDEQQTKIKTANKELHDIRNEICKRVEILKRLENDHITVLAERTAATEKNKALKEQLVTFEVPPILDYVRQKQRLGTDRKTVHNLKTKIEIAEAELAQYRNVWRTLQSSMVVSTCAQPSLVASTYV